MKSMFRGFDFDDWLLIIVGGIRAIVSVIALYYIKIHLFHNPKDCFIASLLVMFAFVSWGVYGYFDGKGKKE